MQMTSAFCCIQCASSAAVPVWSDCRDYYLQKPLRVDYARCVSCGLIQQAPIPTDLAVLYDAYPIHQKKSWMYRYMRSWVMGSCYFDTRRYIKGLKKPAVLLDFGCGDGWFLDENQGGHLNLMGFEPDPGHAARLTRELRLPVYAEERELLQDHAGLVDVVTMHFVMEHLTDINHAFETVYRLLKPDGIFYFVIPNIGSWEARLFGKKWHNLDAPRHISFPQAPSIKQLSERWGFDVVKSQSACFPNGVAASLSVVLTGRFRFPIYLLFLPVGLLLARLFPSGNTAYCLRKTAPAKAVDQERQPGRPQ